LWLPIRSNPNPNPNWRQHIENCGFQLEACRNDCGIPARRMDFPAHYDTCPNEQLRCGLCSAYLLRKEVDYHNDTLCLRRDSLCEWGCGKSMPFEDLRGHRHLCPAIEVPCPQECGVMVKRGLIEDHVNQDCMQECLRCGRPVLP